MGVDTPHTDPVSCGWGTWMCPPPHRPRSTWDEGGMGVWGWTCPTQAQCHASGAHGCVHPHAHTPPMSMPPSSTPTPSSSRVRAGAGSIRTLSRRDIFALILIDPTFALLALTIGHIHAHHAPLISPLAPLPSLNHPHVPCDDR